MLYAILAYHVEADVMSWTPEEDAALMTDLLQVHDRLNQQGSARTGGAARRDGATPAPCAVREPEWCSTGRLPKPKSNCWALCGRLRH